MSRAGITFVGAVAIVAAASVGQADKERCKVKIGGDYHFLDRTYTQGRCEQEAKKYAASRLCESPDQHFDIRYRFDDVAHEVSGHCRLYMSDSSSAPSHDRERCKVKIGDDYHFLDRTYTRSTCEEQAKKYAASRLCDRADQHFDIRYRFDDVPYETTGNCRRYR